jgi:hypothetical protein
MGATPDYAGRHPLHAVRAMGAACLALGRQLADVTLALGGDRGSLVAHKRALENAQQELRGIYAASAEQRVLELRQANAQLGATHDKMRAAIRSALTLASPASGPFGRGYYIPESVRDVLEASVK